MKNIFAMLCAFVCAALAAVTCSAAYPKHVSVTTPAGRTVTVVALSDNVMKIINTPAGTVETAGGRLSVFDESGLGECLNPGGKGVRANFCGTTLSLQSDGVLTIDGGPGKKIVDSGLRPLGSGSRQLLELQLDARGSFYGAGERGHSLDLRGDTLVMYNRQNYGYTGSDPRISQMNITMPLFLASDGFAVVFDDFGAGELILGDPVRYLTETSHPVSWYYVNGASSLADVTTALTSLTGRQELPPVWSLGYITSKYGYRDQAETLGVIDTLKTAGYPVDGIVLDLYWYGKEQDMGRLAWDPVQWPDPSGMMRQLKDKGVNLVAISQPYVLRNGKGADNYNTLAPKGLFVADSMGRAPQEVKIWVGEGGMWDMSNPATRSWLSNRYRELTDMGVSGWWGDLGEPEVHPESGQHANGLRARDYHNQYGNDWSSVIYDLFKQEYPGTRLMTMMRGGTTGLQRYDVFPWSTDVSRSWGGLEPQVRIMLNSGLSGLGYMGHDVGGFAVDPENPVDPELYVRWLQLGLFSPVLRTHAQHMAEPYKYPEYENIIKPLILERYRWLPYNYTLAWENATLGWPLVRPLNFHSSDPALNYDGISDEFLWGSEVLVAPVMKQGAVSRPVVFPAGSDWFDMSDPRRVYKGGTEIADYPAPLSVIPLFARAGAFIPLADYPMENTGDYDPSRYTVEYYPSGRSSFTMFEDDRVTPSAQSGNAGRTITFTGDDSGRTIEVTMTAEGLYTGADRQKTITLVFNGITARPKKVRINKHSTSFVYDEAKATVTVNVKWKLAKPAMITLER